MKLTNKTGRQIGIPGSPALILKADESVSVSADQVKEFLKHQTVVHWLDDGAIVLTLDGCKIRYKGKAERMVIREAANWRKREREERADKARAKYQARLKAAAKRKSNRKVLRSTEPKLISVRPSEAIPEDHEGNYWPPAIPVKNTVEDSFDKTDIVSGRDFNEDSFDKIEGHVPKNGPINEFGHTSTDTFGEQHVPNEILAEAIRNNDRVGVDRLAFGRPAGNIFPPDHWMYDEGRDYFMSLPVFDNSDKHPWDRDFVPPYPQRAQIDCGRVSPTEAYQHA